MQQQGAALPTVTAQQALGSVRVFLFGPVF
jgi:hypothetical protein